jgi:hypothetical protein
MGIKDGGGDEETRSAHRNVMREVGDLCVRLWELECVVHERAGEPMTEVVGAC